MMESCVSVRRNEVKSGRIIWIMNLENDGARNVKKMQ